MTEDLLKKPEDAHLQSFSFLNLKLRINKLLLVLQTESARKNSKLRKDMEQI